MLWAFSFPAFLKLWKYKKIEDKKIKKELKAIWWINKAMHFKKCLHVYFIHTIFFK